MSSSMLQILLKSLPSLVTFIFTIGNFNRSLVMDAIEANNDLCADSINQLKKQKSDRFSCIGPGMTALSVTNSAISFALSLFITSYFIIFEDLRILFAVLGVILMIGVLVYRSSYKQEMFKMEDELEKYRFRMLRIFQKRAGVVVSLIAFILSLAVSSATIFFSG